MAFGRGKGGSADEPTGESDLGGLEPQDYEADFGEEGRVLLRKSGTEPCVRVMVEADTQTRAEQAAEHLAAVVRERLSL